MKKVKIAALAAAVVLAAGMLAGCQGKKPSSAVNSNSANARESGGATIGGNEEAAGGSIITSAKDEGVPSGEVAYTGGPLKTASSPVLDNVSFVMIYNPYIYNESDAYGRVSSKELSTGSLGSQIVTGMNRAGGLDDMELPTMISQADLRSGLEDLQVNREANRAGGLPQIYMEGDSEVFYHYNPSMTARVQDYFDCLYAGSSCYVWVLDGQISSAQAEMLGTEFDDLIFQKDTDNFGVGRYVDNGDKVNILCYDLSDKNIGGFFSILDIFSSYECSSSDVRNYGLNTDKAIININGKAIRNLPDFAKSTLAHEYQHMICASEAFYYSETPFVKTWLDEAMAAYAEELSYPGIKNEGHYNQLMYFSDNFRNGQSLYNFSTEGDEYIGAYGAVYLFSQYMKDLAGEDVFWYVHDYWRNSFRRDVTEAEALYNAVPEETRNSLDEAYAFSER